MGEQKTAIVLLLSIFFAFVSISEIDIVEAKPKTLVVPDEYPTITSALGNATDGDTIFLKRGTYDGPINQTLIIDKAISLVGADSEDTILNLHPNYTQWSICTQTYRSDPDAIRIEADGVRLSNLKLDYIGEIRVISDRVQIVNNNIKSHNTVRGLIVNGSNCNITDNYLFGQITLEGSSSHTIHQNNFSFLRLESTNSSIIESNTFRWLYLDSSHNNIVSRNSINTVNLAYAIGMSNSNSNIFHYNKVTVTNWNINLKLTQSQNNTFYNNAFFDDDDDPHVELDRNSANNFWDNRTIGNYWSNYNGTDSNCDGIGDTFYTLWKNSRDKYPLMAPVTFFDAGTWEWTPFNVDVVSNSTVSDFSFSPESALIQFITDGEEGTTGFCRVTIPKGLLTAQGNWAVLINGISTTPTVNEDRTNTYLYFTYYHSTKTIRILGTDAIPEFPLVAILPLLIVATLIGASIRNKLRKKFRMS